MQRGAGIPGLVLSGDATPEHSKAHRESAEKEFKRNLVLAVPANALGVRITPKNRNKTDLVRSGHCYLNKVTPQELQGKKYY